MVVTAMDAIDTCAAEPIHLSGAIQPHGYLVVCRRGDWSITHASDNIAALLGRPAQVLLGEDLRGELSADVMLAIDDALVLMEPGRPAQRCCRDNIGAFGRLCDVAMHVDGERVLLEFEPVRRNWLDASSSLLADGLIGRVLAQDADSGFFESCASQVRRMTGFDRVMVYRFLDDGSGEVVAEACEAGAVAYLGLRFPAFDIPAQARALYLRNRIRAIPDAGYVPVPLVPDDAASLDLGQSLLRSVSGVHLDYLANMGVAASLSVSIVSGGQLWGLLVCHHASPLHVEPPVRAALELFGRFLSLRVTTQQQELMLEESGAVDYLADSIAESVLRTGDLTGALLQWMAAVRVLFDADSTAVLTDGGWVGASAAIEPHELAAVQRQLARARSTGVVHLDRRAQWVEGDAGRHAGLLALQLAGGTWLVLLRCELVHVVRWAGQPAKRAEDDGGRIGPRRSFAEWQEQVRGRCEPWSHRDLRKAHRFCRGFVDLRQRLGADRAAADAALQRSRQDALDDRRLRLLDVAEMLEALPPLDDELSHAIAEHVQAFDRQLRDLILRRPRTAAGGMSGRLPERQAADGPLAAPHPAAGAEASAS